MKLVKTKYDEETGLDIIKDVIFDDKNDILTHEAFERKAYKV